MWRYLIFAIDLSAALLVGFAFIGGIILTDLHLTPALGYLRQDNPTSIWFVCLTLVSGFWMFFSWAFTLLKTDRLRLADWTRVWGMGTVNFTGIFVHGVEHSWSRWINLPMAGVGITCTLALVATFLLYRAANLPHTAIVLDLLKPKAA